MNYGLYGTSLVIKIYRIWNKMIISLLINIFKQWILQVSVRYVLAYSWKWKYFPTLDSLLIKTFLAIQLFVSYLTICSSQLSVSVIHNFMLYFKNKIVRKTLIIKTFISLNLLFLMLNVPNFKNDFIIYRKDLFFFL